MSPAFASSRGFQVEPSYHQLEFTSGIITSSLSIGNVDSVKGFLPRGESIHLDFYVLDNLSADILLCQDTIEELNIFGLHAESFIPAILKLGESDVNIIQYTGTVENLAGKVRNKLKPGVERVEEGRFGRYATLRLMAFGGREYANVRLWRANVRMLAVNRQETTLTRKSAEKLRAQEIENDRIRGWEEERERQKMTTGNVHQTTPRNPSSTSSVRAMISSVSGDAPTSIPLSNGRYMCTFAGCSVPAFQSQDLLER